MEDVTVFLRSYHKTSSAFHAGSMLCWRVEACGGIMAELYTLRLGLVSRLCSHMREARGVTSVKRHSNSPSGTSAAELTDGLRFSDVRTL